MKNTTASGASLRHKADTKSSDDYQAPIAEEKAAYNTTGFLCGVGECGQLDEKTETSEDQTLGQRGDLQWLKAIICTSHLHRYQVRSYVSTHFHVTVNLKCLER